MHLAREADRRHLSPVRPDGGPRGVGQGVTPVLRGALGPPRAQRADGVGGGSLAYDVAVLGHKQGLDRAGAEIQAEQHGG